MVGLIPKAAMQKIEAMLSADSLAEAIVKSSGNTMDPKRLVRVALHTIQRTPLLAECMNSQEGKASLWVALQDCAELQLMPDRHGHCYLVPYKIHGVRQVQMQLGYKGLITLLNRGVHKIPISARLVFAADTFEVHYGTNARIVHRPCLDDNKRGEVIGGYWMASVDGGSEQFEYFTIGQIHKYRDRSPAYKFNKTGTPWSTDHDAMCQKTLIHRAAARLPLDPMVAADLDRDIGRDEGEVGMGQLIQDDPKAVPEADVEGDTPTTTAPEPQRESKSTKTAAKARERSKSKSKGKPAAGPQDQPPDPGEQTTSAKPEPEKESGPNTQAAPPAAKTEPPPDPPGDGSNTDPAIMSMRRKRLMAVASEMASAQDGVDGDMMKMAEAAKVIMGEWTGRIDLKELDGDDLEIAIACCEEEYKAWMQDQAPVEEEATTTK